MRHATNRPRMTPCVSATELARRVRDFEESCRTHNIKVTSQRLAIFACLARSPHHPDAETVHREVRRKLPRTSLDTVYRNLRLFVDLGMANVLSTPQGLLRFEADISVHHHFICRQCGQVDDLSDSSHGALPQPQALAQLGTVERTTIEYRGLCRACSAKPTRRKRSP